MRLISRLTLNHGHLCCCSRGDRKGVLGCGREGENFRPTCVKSIELAANLISSISPSYFLQAPEPISITNPTGDKLTDNALVQTIKFALKRHVRTQLSVGCESTVSKLHVAWFACSL